MIDAGAVRLAVRRVVDPAEEAGDGLALTGTWDAHERPAVLATAGSR